MILVFLTSLKGTEIEYASVGNKAPLFKVENEFGSSELQGMKGKYVIVNFWSSNDAKSRIENAMLDKSIANLQSEKLSLVSINLDEDKTLYSQIVKTDKLESRRQYSALDATVGNLFADYHLENGNNVFLINPDGMIEAINPSVSQLTKLF